MNLRYAIAKIKCRLKKSQQPMIEYYRRNGAQVGDNCLICSNILTAESFLVHTGSNTTISTGVTLVTHDFSAHLISDKSNFYGEINIGDNCFIGANSTLMYGVTLADNIIVAAGSVVTKSFSESGIIIGGNPARQIGTWDKFTEKNKEKAVNRSEVFQRYQTDKSFLVKR